MGAHSGPTWDAIDTAVRAAITAAGEDPAVATVRLVDITQSGATPLVRVAVDKDIFTYPPGVLLIYG